MVSGAHLEEWEEGDGWGSSERSGATGAHCLPRNSLTVATLLGLRLRLAYIWRPFGLHRGAGAFNLVPAGPPAADWVCLGAGDWHT